MSFIEGKSWRRPRGAFAALPAAALAALIAFGAAAADVDANDSQFLQDAIRSDIAEVKLSELALQRSNDDGVRDLAHRLQTDHSVAMQEAAALAKDLGTRIPSTQSDEAQQHYASLAKLSGAEFDAAFVSHIVGAHREAVRKFDAATKESPNDAIASYAAKTLPTLEEHLAMSESLAGAPRESAAGAPSHERHAGDSAAAHSAAQ